MEEINSIKLDYFLTSVADRNKLVQKIIDNTPPSQLTEKYLEILSNYILDAAMTKEEKKSKYITTSNRQVTIDKRETSYEELVSKFENGEDGVYNLINNDKNMYLTPKNIITAEDYAEVPGMRQLKEEIESIEKQAAAASGKQKYLLKKQAIEMRQQQYILKEMWRQPYKSLVASNTGGNPIELNENIHIDENGEPVSDSIISFFKPEHISAILCNYELLHTHLRHKYSSDFHYLMRDFDKLLREGLLSSPPYQALVRAKIEGHTNAEIQQMLKEEFGLHHTQEYISAIWRKKIPKMLAEKAKKDYLIWYYTEVEYGSWKRCSCCGEVKLAHNYFFSKNNTSKDGYYSICKECRCKKSKKKKET